MKKVIAFIVAGALFGPAVVWGQEGGEAAAPAAAAVPAPNYGLKLRALEEKVNELKEKIFRSKTRLNILADTMIRGSLTGARAQIMHRNEMGSSFKLESVSYALDGAQVYNKADAEGELAGKQEFEVFNAPIVPGAHSLTVTATYTGSSSGLFSYIEGYKFRVRSSYTFQAQEGKVSKLRVVGYERGSITSEMKDRPAIRFDLDIKADTGNVTSVPIGK